MTAFTLIHGKDNTPVPPVDEAHAMVCFTLGAAVQLARHLRNTTHLDNIRVVAVQFTMSREVMDEGVVA